MMAWKSVDMDMNDYQHANAEISLNDELNKVINRHIRDWHLTTPQIMGILESLKLSTWAAWQDVAYMDQEDDE